MYALIVGSLLIGCDSSQLSPQDQSKLSNKTEIVGNTKNVENNNLHKFLWLYSNIFFMQVSNSSVLIGVFPSLETCIPAVIEPKNADTAIFPLKA